MKYLDKLKIIYKNYTTKKSPFQLIQDEYERRKGE